MKLELKKSKTFPWALNTSNQGKLAEYQRLFDQYGIFLSSTHVDLPEIDADPLSIAVHKASQMGPGVLVDDTSLHIEGADVGSNVRWFKNRLTEYIGKKGIWVVLIAYLDENQVHVYKGQVEGAIVAPQGEDGFGFDPFFLPNGAIKTIAEERPDTLNARALAVKALINGEAIAHVPVMMEWKGRWQPH